MDKMYIPNTQISKRLLLLRHARLNFNLQCHNLSCVILAVERKMFESLEEIKEVVKLHTTTKYHFEEARLVERNL